MHAGVSSLGGYYMMLQISVQAQLQRLQPSMSLLQAGQKSLLESLAVPVCWPAAVLLLSRHEHEAVAQKGSDLSDVCPSCAQRHL